MKAKQYLDVFLWRRVKEEWYEYECVWFAKHAVSKIHKRTLSSFWWSAISWWISWSPFNKSRTRIYNKPELIPKQGDVIFFDATRNNRRWHVAIVYQADANSVLVIEQNWVWTKSGLKWDAIRLKTYNYLSPRCLWWFTLNP